MADGVSSYFGEGGGDQDAFGSFGDGDAIDVGAGGTVVDDTQQEEQQTAAAAASQAASPVGPAADAVEESSFDYFGAAGANEDPFGLGTTIQGLSDVDDATMQQPAHDQQGQQQQGPLAPAAAADASEAVGSYFDDAGAADPLGLGFGGGGDGGSGAVEESPWMHAQAMQSQPPQYPAPVASAPVSPPPVAVPTPLQAPMVAPVVSAPASAASSPSPAHTMHAPGSAASTPSHAAQTPTGASAAAVSSPLPAPAMSIHSATSPPPFMQLPSASQAQAQTQVQAPEQAPQQAEPVVPAQPSSPAQPQADPIVNSAVAETEAEAAPSGVDDYFAAADDWLQAPAPPAASIAHPQPVVAPVPSSQQQPMPPQQQVQTPPAQVQSPPPPAQAQAPAAAPVVPEPAAVPAPIAASSAAPAAAPAPVPESASPVDDYFASADDWLQPQAQAEHTVVAESPRSQQQEEPQSMGVSSSSGGAVDDYFQSGGDDWLQAPAPLVAPPQSQQHAQPPQPHAQPFAYGSSPYNSAQPHQAPPPPQQQQQQQQQPPHAHHALPPQQAHPSPHSFPGAHIVPPALSDQLNEVDLNSPAKPNRSVNLSADLTGGLADVSLSSSPRGSPSQQSQRLDFAGAGFGMDDAPQRVAPPMPMPMAHSALPPPARGAPQPFMPAQPPQQAAAVATATAPMPAPYGRAGEYGSGPPPQTQTQAQHPYGAAAPYRPPMPQASSPHQPFMPGQAQPPAPQAQGQGQQSAHVAGAPWQPQPQAPQQNQQQQQQQQSAPFQPPSQGHSGHNTNLYAPPALFGGPPGGPGPNGTGAGGPAHGHGASSVGAPRPWSPPPACPVVCFGFGGKFISMIPRAPAQLGLGRDPYASPSGGASGGALKAGPVVIESLSELLESQSFVQRLSSFPGPLAAPAALVATAPAATKKSKADEAKQSEVESLVQNWADQSLHAPLPRDSPLAALAAGGDPAIQAEMLSNYRSSKRLLYLFLLQLLRQPPGAGGVHRASNPASLHTAPRDPALPPGVEERMISYLIQLDPAPASASASAPGAPSASAGADGQWLDNAASSHDGAVVPSPLRAASGPDGADGVSPDPSEDHASQPRVLSSLQTLLLRGQRKEACALAVTHKLWAHALLLASFDMATYHSVVGAFATQGFADGAPLQTLYLLFAQQPAALFRGVPGPDGRGADGAPVPGPHVPSFLAPNAPPLLRHWRANLAVMLANPTPSDKSVLTTLADTLWQNYSLPPAAHLVYMLAGHGLGPDLPGAAPHALPPGRVLLLGSDHRKHMRTFVTPAAVQRTEVLEYARAMAAASAAAGAPQPPSPLSPGFQLFKLVYAHQLAEFGFGSRALAYCEQLAALVQVSASKGAGKPGVVWPSPFLSALENLHERLREHLNAKSEPGIGKRIAGKLFNWIVGDSAQAPGTTTVVPPTPSPAAATAAHDHAQRQQQQHAFPPVTGAQGLQRSASSSVLTNPAAAAGYGMRGPGQQQQQHQQGGFGQHAGGQPHGLQSSVSEHNLSAAHQGFGQGHGQGHHPGAASYDGRGGQGGLLHPSSAGAQQQSQAHSPHMPGPPKHTRSVTEPQASAGTPTGKKDGAAASPPAAAGDGAAEEQPKKGLFGRVLGGIWGGGKKKVPTANLREEHSFVFDDALGRWVCKDASGKIVEEEEEKPVAPPTISDEMKAKFAAAASASPPPPPGGMAQLHASPGPSPPMGAPGQSASPPPSGPGMPAPPSSMFASRAGGGARSRYALADTSFADAGDDGPAPSVPAPGMPSLFPAPMPGAAPPMPGAHASASAAAGGPLPPSGPVPAFKVFRPAAPAPQMPGAEGHAASAPAAQQQQQHQTTAMQPPPQSRSPFGTAAPPPGPNGSGHGHAHAAPPMPMPMQPSQPQQPHHSGAPPFPGGVAPGGPGAAGQFRAQGHPYPPQQAHPGPAAPVHGGGATVPAGPYGAPPMPPPTGAPMAGMGGHMPQAPRFAMPPAAAGTGAYPPPMAAPPMPMPGAMYPPPPQGHAHHPHPHAHAPPFPMPQAGAGGAYAAHAGRPPPPAY